MGDLETEALIILGQVKAFEQTSGKHRQRPSESWVSRLRWEQLLNRRAGGRVGARWVGATEPECGNAPGSSGEGGSTGPTVFGPGGTGTRAKNEFEVFSVTKRRVRLINEMRGQEEE